MPNFSDKVVSPWYDVNINGVPRTELPGFTTFEDFSFIDRNGYIRPINSMGSFGPSCFFNDGCLLVSFIYSTGSSNSYGIGVLPGSNSVYGKNSDYIYYTQTPLLVSPGGNVQWASPMVCVNDGLATQSGGRIILGTAAIDSQSYKGCFTIRTNSKSPGAGFFPEIAHLPISESGTVVSSPVLFGEQGYIILNNSSCYLYIPESTSSPVIKVGDLPANITQELNNRPAGRVASTNTFLYRYTHWDTNGRTNGKKTIFNSMRSIYIGSQPYLLEKVFSPPGSSDIICAACYCPYDSSWRAVVTNNYENFSIYVSRGGVDWYVERSITFRSVFDNISTLCTDPVSIFPFRGRVFVSAGNGLSTYIDTSDESRYLNARGASALQPHHYSQPHVSIYNDSKMSFSLNTILQAPVIAGHNTIVI